MGMQQILLIIVGVIIVGIAITVGIVMFSSGSFNSNKSSIAADLQNYSMNIIQYWKLPTAMGGASQLLSNVSMAAVGATLGFTEAGGVYAHSNDNGEYRLLSLESGVIVVGALGVETKGNLHPYAEMTMDFLTQDVATTVAEQEGF